MYLVGKHISFVYLFIMQLGKKWLILLKSEFAKEKDKVEGRVLFMRLKMEQQEEEQVQNYADWIFTAGKCIYIFIK